MNGIAGDGSRPIGAGDPDGSVIEVGRQTGRSTSAVELAPVVELATPTSVAFYTPGRSGFHGLRSHERRTDMRSSQKASPLAKRHYEAEQDHRIATVHHGNFVPKDEMIVRNLRIVMINRP